MFTNNIDPIVLEFGHFHVNYYTILMLAAFIVAYLISLKIAKERKIDRAIITDFLVYAVISVIIGARLFHVFAYSWPYFSQKPIEILYVWNGGLSSHGAIIGVAIALIIFTRVRKIPFYELADIVAIATALGAMFIRIGNFTNSELIGRVTDLPWGVKFLRRDPEAFRHPVQLYEALKNLILFVILFKLRRKALPKGVIFWAAIGGFCLLRFFVEFYKEYLIFKGGLTAGQIYSIPFIILSVIMIIYLFRKDDSNKLRSSST